MREMLRYGVILGSICIVASGLLAQVNSLTHSKIINQAKEEEERSLREVLPQGETFEPIKSGNILLYYKVKDKKGGVVGYAFKVSSKGYSSVIDALVAIEKDASTIIAIKVLSHNETPGLGSRISEPSFKNQFANKNIRSLNEVQAITGATISSKTVIDSVKKKLEEIQGIIKDAR